MLLNKGKTSGLLACSSMSKRVIALMKQFLKRRYYIELAKSKAELELAKAKIEDLNAKAAKYQADGMQKLG